MDAAQAVLSCERPTGGAHPSEGEPAFRMAAELAHDLRSPVSAIRALAEGLREGAAGPLNPEQRRQLGLIRSAASCLCDFATDIEDLARGSARLIDAGPAPFSIRAVLAEIRKLVAPLQEAKAVPVHFVAPPPGDDRRLGHRRALSRILLNLTMNALHATDRGAVTVSARPRDPQRMEFSVCDTGSGFDIRTQAAGLGLTICRDLIGALGSTLEMHSRPGSGTRARFTIELPPLAAPR